MDSHKNARLTVEVESYWPGKSWSRGDTEVEAVLRLGLCGCNKLPS
jgi:hypothetical protein